MIAGEVHFTFANVPAILGHVRSGRVRALAVAGPKRSELMPDVPTMADAGVSGVEVPVWYALLGPANLPREVVKTLNDATVRAARSAELRQKLAEQGAEAIGGPPEAFEKHIAAEREKWSRVIKTANIVVN